MLNISEEIFAVCREIDYERSHLAMGARADTVLQRLPLARRSGRYRKKSCRDE